MLEILDFEGPSAKQWEMVMTGVRRPLKSYAKGDSKLKYRGGPFGEVFVLGQNDYDLLKRLNKSPEECKYKRQLNYVISIDAPMYWWKQFDTYKIGVTQNSESTMHTILKTPITPECFSTDYINDDLIFESFEIYCNILENLRQSALKCDTYEESQKYFNMIIQLLPESYMLKRTVSIPLAQLENIYRQRRYHKLPEWIAFIDFVLEDIEYPELIVGFGE